MNHLPLKRFWLWRQNNAWGWIETTLFTLMVLAGLYFINPENPLFINEGFPWPWIAPVIIMFHYGFGPSIFSTSIIITVSVLQQHLHNLPFNDFQTYLISGVALVLICGLFSSNLIRRMLTAETLATYAKERLASLSATYHMLRISYDYLEQNIITKPSTLRLTLLELHKRNLLQEAPLSTEVAYSFLQVLAQFCSLDAMGIYLYDDKEILTTKPYAEVGMMGELELQDPLIKECLEMNEMCYVSIKQIEDLKDCKYLVAIPLITNQNKKLGMLVIKDMSFWSLTEELLRIINILTYYFIRNTVSTTAETLFMQTYPNCSIDFTRQLIKLTALKRDMNIDSALVAIVISKQLRTHHLVYNIINKQRMLDSNYVFETEEYDVLVLLMPFTAAAGIYGYISRINNYLHVDLGLTLDPQLIKMRSMQLDSRTPLELMDYFINFIAIKRAEST